jgi:hypothetical protein
MDPRISSFDHRGRRLKRFHAPSRMAMAISGVAQGDWASGWCQLWMVKRSPASARRMLRTAAPGSDAAVTYARHGNRSRPAA